MAQQRALGWYWVRQTPDQEPFPAKYCGLSPTGRTTWNIGRRLADDDELCEIGEPLLPPSAAPSQTQPDKCAKCGHPKREHAYTGACYGLCGEFVPQDLVPATVFEAEPGQPSNPAVAGLGAADSDPAPKERLDVYGGECPPGYDFIGWTCPRNESDRCAGCDVDDSLPDSCGHGVKGYRSIAWREWGERRRATSPLTGPVNHGTASNTDPNTKSTSASEPPPDPLRVALEYAASTLENEHRSDPTLQDLARSLRAALEAKA